MLYAINHRTNPVAKVDQLSSRKGLLITADTHWITKRLSILLSGHETELTEFDRHFCCIENETSFVLFRIMGDHSAPPRVDYSSTLQTTIAAHIITRRHNKKYMTLSTLLRWEACNNISKCPTDVTLTQTPMTCVLFEDTLKTLFPLQMPPIASFTCITNI